MVQSTQQSGTQVPASQIGQRILRATGALMGIQIILKGFGAIEKIILGHLFGASYLTDAYNAAKDIAFYIFQMVDQVVMHSFLPVFVQRMREHGEEDAWRLASTIINALIPLMLLVAVIGAYVIPHLLPFFVPDWFTGNPKQNAALIPLTITLTRLMLAAVIFLATSSLTYCLLNSYKKFALPASADLALKGTVLVFAILLAHVWGPIALAVGFVCGAVAKVAVHAGGLRRSLLHYQPVTDFRHAGVKQFGILALPLLISVSFSIVRQIMDTRFTSSLTEGSLSALKFARTICDTPVQFFPFAFGIALFPFLADIALAGDRDRLRGMLMMATRMMVLIFVPLATVIILLREPLVLVAFGPKAMITTEPLQIYAIGMLIGALEIIVLQFFFAMSDTVRPAVVGVVMVPLHIAASYLGVYHLGWGMMGIAGALLFSKGTKVIVLYAMIRRKVAGLEGRRTLGLVVKVVVALLPLAALLFWATHSSYFPEPAHVKGKLKMLLALCPYGLIAGVGGIIYFALLHWLRADEVNLLVERVAGKLRKRKASASA